jgi:hypothetical protein
VNWRAKRNGVDGRLLSTWMTIEISTLRMSTSAWRGL